MVSYYSRLQRVSEGYTARVFEQLWPSSSVRRSVAGFLASFIERAAGGTSAWAVVLDPDVVKLDVGPVQLLSLTSDHVWFCTLGTRDLSRPKWVRDTSGRKTAVYKSVAVPSRGLSITPDRVSRIPKSLRNKALEYVSVAASRRRGKSSWAYAHSPGVITFLNNYLGTSLSGTEEAPSPQQPSKEPVDRALEGMAREGSVLSRVRNGALRREALQRAHGRCCLCETNFSSVLDGLGLRALQVHHLHQIAAAQTPRLTRVDELVVVCANCHCMIHSDAEHAIAPPTLRDRLRESRPSSIPTLDGATRALRLTTAPGVSGDR